MKERMANHVKSYDRGLGVSGSAGVQTSSSEPKQEEDIDEAKTKSKKEESKKGRSAGQAKGSGK